MDAGITIWIIAKLTYYYVKYRIIKQLLRHLLHFVLFSLQRTTLKCEIMFVVLMQVNKLLIYLLARHRFHSALLCSIELKTSLSMLDTNECIEFLFLVSINM